MNEAAATFFANTRTPKQAQLDWLKAQGVPNLAMGCDDDGAGFVLGAAEIRIDGPWFDFVGAAEEGAQAGLVIVSRDCGGTPIDLTGWAPRSGDVGIYFGRGYLLGGHNLFGPQLAGPLKVHRSVLGYLKAGRRGCVILDRQRAWHLLEGVRIQAEDIEHGKELRRVLTPPAPSIMIPQPTMAVAA